MQSFSCAKIKFENFIFYYFFIPLVIILSFICFNNQGKQNKVLVSDPFQPDDCNLFVLLYFLCINETWEALSCIYFLLFSLKTKLSYHSTIVSSWQDAKKFKYSRLFVWGNKVILSYERWTYFESVHVLTVIDSVHVLTVIDSVHVLTVIDSVHVLTVKRAVSGDGVRRSFFSDRHLLNHWSELFSYLFAKKT